MSTLRSFSAALPSLDLRTIGDIEQEIVDELQFHIDMRTQDNLRAGMRPEEARQAADELFGDFATIHSDCRRTLLGKRLMLQKLQAALSVVLLLAVTWLAYRIHAGQQATESALGDFTAAFKQLAEKPHRAEPPQPAAAPALPTHDLWPNRPVVVGTFPQTGATDVDPATSEIRVTFSKPMADENWSWVRSSQFEFPESHGDVRYLDDAKTCVMPVKLKPATKYVVWLNRGEYQNFKDLQGRPAEPYMLAFTTRAEELEEPTQ